MIPDDDSSSSISINDTMFWSNNPLLYGKVNKNELPLSDLGSSLPKETNDLPKETNDLHDASYTNYSSSNTISSRNTKFWYNNPSSSGRNTVEDAEKL